MIDLFGWLYCSLITGVTKNHDFQNVVFISFCQFSQQLNGGLGILQIFMCIEWGKFFVSSFPCNPK